MNLVLPVAHTDTYGSFYTGVVLCPYFANDSGDTNSSFGERTVTIHPGKLPALLPPSGLVSTELPPSGLVSTELPPSGLVSTELPPSGLVSTDPERPSAVGQADQGVSAQGTIVTSDSITWYPAPSVGHRLLVLAVFITAICLSLSYEQDTSSPHYGTVLAWIWGAFGGTSDSFLQWAAVAKIPHSPAEVKALWQQKSNCAKGWTLASILAMLPFVMDYVYSLWIRLENTSMPAALSVTGAVVAPLKPLLAISEASKVSASVKTKYHNAPHVTAVCQNVLSDVALLLFILWIVASDTANKAILNPAYYGLDNCSWDLSLKCALLLPDAMAKSVFMYSALSGMVQSLENPKENATQWLKKVFGGLPDCAKGAKSVLKTSARCALPLVFMATLYSVLVTRVDRTKAARQYQSPYANDTGALGCQNFAQGVGEMNYFATYALQIVTYIFALGGSVSTAVQVLVSTFLLRSCMNESSSDESGDAEGQDTTSLLDPSNPPNHDYGSISSELSKGSTENASSLVAFDGMPHDA